MILIKNTQRNIAIPVALLKREAQGILKCLDYVGYDVGIWVTTNRTIQQYNATYRGKNKPTDILSFPFHTDLRAGDRIEPLSDDEKNLGDIIISAERVAADAKKYGVSFNDHLRTILVHGVCHLLGYDHMTDDDFIEMEKMENYLLDCLVSTS